MTALGILLAWAAMQATLFALLGGLAYSVVRRRGPAAGSLALSACLALLLGLFALSFSPWPRWWSVAGGASPAHATPGNLPADEGVAIAGSNAPNEPLAANAQAPVKVAAGRESGSTAWTKAAFWTDVARNMQDTPAPQGTGWTWPAIAASVFLTGAAAGMARLGWGLLAVRQYRRSGRAVCDAVAVDLLCELRAELRCTRPAELRECAGLTSPATIGWRRPLVLLPADWRTWTPTELRAVLAHELAHVCRGDFAAWLLAQCCLAVQFYHPLVHWLANRLRLEQELAADARGAAAAGGREQYLASLAAMALRADDRRLAWAARPFLPKRGTLLWRIDMLRIAKPGLEAPHRPLFRRSIVAVLAAAALLVAGLRGPAGDETQVASADEPADKKASDVALPPIDLRFVPYEALYVIAARPAELLKHSETKPLVEALDQLTPFAGTGLTLDQIDEVKVVVDSWLGPRNPRLIFKAAGPVDWAAVMAKTPLFRTALEAEYGGKTYYLSALHLQLKKERFARLGWYSPDDRTLIVAPEHGIPGVILEETKPERLRPPSWSKQWARLAHSHLIVACDMSRLNVANLAERQRDASNYFILPLVSPLIENGSFVGLGATVGDSLSVEGRLAANSPAAAQTLKTLIDGLTATAGVALTQAESDANAQPNGAGEIQKTMLRLASELRASATIEIADNDLTLRATSQQGAQTVVTTLAKALVAAHIATQRAQAAENLTELAIALQNYEGIYQKLPPPVVLGPNGVPRSWRVELLPFLGAKDLYESYRKDEPWDSEFNKRILANIPDAFRDPTAAADSLNTSYFAVTGETTCFYGTEGMPISRIADGISNTGSLVEAKRDIPWTKPEDIPFEFGKVLPQFGGSFAGGFHVLMVDGSVKFVPEALAPQVLPPLFTKDRDDRIPQF